MKYHIKTLKNNKKDTEKVKNFLFKMIEKEYGYSYIPQYHYDIKNLSQIYLNPEKNTFLIAEDKKENIIGTIGIRQLDKEFEELNLAYKNKYPYENTASIWRVFVDKKHRRKGIGRKLVKRAEFFVKKMKYDRLYLHTHKDINGALDFWLSQDYDIILDTNNELKTIHMEKNKFKLINNLKKRHIYKDHT